MAVSRRRWVPIALLSIAAQEPQHGVRPAVAAPSQQRPAMPLPPATLDDTLDVAGEDIAAWTSQNRMTVPVTLNGRGPYRFVVDSGADRSAIGQRLARDLALPPGPTVTLHGMAGASRRATALIDRLQVGSSGVAAITAPVLFERDLGAQGLLGIDALAGQRLMLDFEDSSIVVEDARRPLRWSGDDIVVTARRYRGQLILTEARAAGIGVKAVIDTGSELTIGNLRLRDALFRRARRTMFTPVEMISVTGDRVTAQRALVRELRLGGIVMRDVPIAFADLAPFALFGLVDAPAMMLGSDLMSSFRRVSLDFRARRVRFQLQRCASRGIGRSRGAC